jgi:hypothetical protein
LGQNCKILPLTVTESHGEEQALFAVPALLVMARVPSLSGVSI